MRTLRFLVAAIVALALSAPASAAFAPTYSLTYAPLFGSPNAGRIVVGTITLSATDTYVTGGLTITPANLGFVTNIASLTIGSTNSAFTPVASISGVNAVLKFNNAQSGAANVAAAATTATVSTGVSGLAANTPILCILDDAATGGGGSGTWATTAAVSSCKFVTATSFTATTTAAAPAGGGNFTWFVPNSVTEIANATSVASVVVNFVATGN